MLVSQLYPRQRAERSEKNGGLGEDPPGSPMSHLGPKDLSRSMAAAGRGFPPGKKAQNEIRFNEVGDQTMARPTIKLNVCSVGSDIRIRV
jgi:hypothetical protein